MTHEVLRRPADLYDVAPRAQALSHCGRDAAFHYDHGLVRRSSIEIPAGTRDRLLRIEAPVGEIEQDLQLRLDLPVAAHAAQNGVQSAPGSGDDRWRERARRSGVRTQGGRPIVERERGAPVLQRETAARDRNACAEIEEETLDKRHRHPIPIYDCEMSRIAPRDPARKRGRKVASPIRIEGPREKIGARAAPAILYRRLEVHPIAVAAISILERGPARLDEKVNRGGIEDIQGRGRARLDKGQCR